MSKKSNKFFPEFQERAGRLVSKQCGVRSLTWALPAARSGRCWIGPIALRQIAVIGRLSVSVDANADKGSQYIGIGYSERLAEAGIAPSVGSRSDRDGNAVADTINEMNKTKLIHRRVLRETTKSANPVTAAIAIRQKRRQTMTTNSRTVS